MTEAANSPQRDMSKTWEGNRQRRRRRLAAELNDSGRWLARPLETDPVPEAPGLYISDTLLADPAVREMVRTRPATLGVWQVLLASRSHRIIIDGKAAIPWDSVPVTLSPFVSKLIDAGLMSSDPDSGSYLFEGAGSIYAIVGADAPESASKRGR